MQKHKFIPKTKVVDPKSEIVRYSTGKIVLHIGMGGFIDNPNFTASYVETDLTQTLHGHLAKMTKNLTGVDINPVTIGAMKKVVPGEYFVADICNPGVAARIARRFDLVLFTEVIEHLDCFRAALENIRTLLLPEGEVLITTVNAYCFENVGKMLFRYDSAHEEHTSYFSYFTIKRLLAMNGFELTRFYFTNQKRSTFTSLFERIAYYTMLGVTRIMPQYSQGIFVLARPTWT